MIENLALGFARRAMLLARGDPTQFITRPISLAFMLGTVVVLAFMIIPAMRRKAE